MNKYAMLHIPDSQYCFPVGLDCIYLRLRLMRGEEVEKVSVIYGCKYEFAVKREEAELILKYSDSLFDYYEVALNLKDVRLAYVFFIKTQEESFYYSEDGLTQTYNFELGYYNFFQMPYIHQADIINTVGWMRDAVFYQIFVDRFYRGDDTKEDSYINLKWGEKPNPKSFAGGDLKGITQKLDYIKSLSVNALYLTPVFESKSNHKYDIHDYFKVDAQFGTNEDLKELITTAHKMGIRVVLDAVFNHCSSLLPQFQDVLTKGRKSEYYDWFIIDGDKPSLDECNYECFASCNYMPKLNTANEGVRRYLLLIACHFIEEYDIDGWRLDVSDEISHDFWRDFRKAVKSRKPECVIIGENWHDANTFLIGDQYDSIMNYAFTKACLDYFAFDVFGAKEFADKLNGLLMRNKKPVNDMMLNLLDSHDTHRFYSQVRKNKDKLLAAIAIEVFFPGAPCIYYGTEIALEGGYDPDCRRTFDWNEDHHDQDFKEAVKELLNLKKERSIKIGEISIQAKNQLFCIKRALGNEELNLFYNGSSEGISIEREVPEASQCVIMSRGVSQGRLNPFGFIITKSV